MRNEGKDSWMYTHIQQKELDRLRLTSEWPDQVILQHFPNNLSRKTFLDVGSGPSAHLWQQIEARGGKYFGTDFLEGMIINQISHKQTLTENAKATRNNMVISCAPQLPFGNNTFDIVNARFVFAHLTPDERIETTQKMVKIARHTVLVSEYDWTPMSSKDHNDRLLAFLDASDKFSEIFNAQRFLGANLLSCTQKIVGQDKTLNVSQKRFGRPEANYGEELVLLCQACAGVSEKGGERKLAQNFLTLASEYSDSPINFTPPDIVTVSISKDLDLQV